MRRGVGPLCGTFADCGVLYAIDPEIRRRTLGHADAAMTSHYTHIEAAAHKAAAEAVARLVEGAGS
jgi:hypothetical protein